MAQLGRFAITFSFHLRVVVLALHDKPRHSVPLHLFLRRVEMPKSERDEVISKLVRLPFRVVRTRHRLGFAFTVSRYRRL